MTRAGFDLMDAAEAYGDAVLALEARVRAWKWGQPPPKLDERFLHDLKSAARKYATSTRKKRKANADA